MKISKCPFSIGQRVKFAPSKRTEGLYQDIDRFGINVGEIAEIKEIRDDIYLYFKNGKGGWPWNEFVKINT